MSEWQPIETAPKDGTTVILCGDPKRYGNPIHLGAWVDYGDFGAWAGFGPDGDVIAWMPLPEPPK